MSTTPNQTARRIHKARRTAHHQSNRQTESNHSRRILATFPAPAGSMSPASVYLVGKRPPLSSHPRVWRWLARFVYRQIGWAPEYGIEYQGVYFDEAEARYAAGAPGMFYMELPLNSSLPDESCQFGKHDFPHSEASSEYRGRRMPFIAVRRQEIDSQLADLKQIDGRLLKLNECIEGTCAKAT